MAIFYVDLINGNDANDGTSWAQAFLTMGGATSAKGVAAGDTVRIAKTEDKTSLGNATWTVGVIPSTKNITSSTNATPIQVTISSHGYATGDVIQITGHTTNTAANGTWIVTNTGTDTFTLDGSVGNGTGGSSGTAQNINTKTVKLASAQTKTVTMCDTAFTAANSAAVALSTNIYKQGTASIQLTTPGAGTVANTRYAYFTLPGGAQDFSAYQKLSFYFAATNGNANSTAYKICLCSDTTGTTIVDTFNVQSNNANAIPVAMTVARVGGGNLGSSIQSVAIYTNTSGFGNNQITRWDNIIACTTDGLNLQSVISPVASNTDVFDNYPIQSIDDTLVLIDNVQASTAVIGRGYFITSGGSITTYFRNPTIPANLITNLVANTLLNAPAIGAVNNYLTYSGGWNTGTTTQDGLTVVQACNATSVIQLNSFQAIESFGVMRGGSAFAQVATKTSNNLTNCFASGFTSTAIQFGAAPQGSAMVNLGTNIITNFGSNNGFIGASCLGIKAIVTSSKFMNHIGSPAGIGGTNLGGTNSLYKSCEASNNNFQGFFITSGSNLTLRDCTAKSNGNFNTGVGCGIEISSNGGQAYFYNTTTNGNTSNAIKGQGGNGVVYFQNLTTNESPAFNNVYNTGQIYVNNWNGDGLARCESFAAQTTTNNSVTHGTAPFSWQTQITSLERGINFPSDTLLATVYCVEDVEVTVSAWFKKSHATNIVNSLLLPGDQLSGIAEDVVATGTATTDWEQLSITFTPTESGVVKIYSSTYLAAGSSDSSYVSDLTLPTGISTQSLAYNLMGEPYAQNQASGSGPVSVAYAAVGL